MDFQNSLRILFIGMTLGLWTRAKADFFTAIAHMEPLLNTHNKIIDSLDDYIANEEKRLAVLKKHLNRYKEEHISASKDISNYFENPINSFTLIKRLTVDLDYLQYSILANPDYYKNIITDIPEVMYPESEDLTGAIEGLARLQETYRLDIAELAKGRIIEKHSSGSEDPGTATPMTASDCFEIGMALYVDEDYHKALLWMKESLRKLLSGDDLFNTTVVDVLEYVSFAHYQLGDVKAAIEWSEKLLILDPKHPGANVNLKFFQHMQDENEIKNKQKGETDEDKNNNDNEEGDQSQTSTSSHEDIDEAKLMKRYEALCRGEIEIPQEVHKRLKCAYLTKNHPFLKLAPFKMEQIYITPDVFLFHEVMNDEEIEYIKTMAKPHILRAEVIDPITGDGIAVPYRISKAVGLREKESEVVKRVTRRTADFTGLNMDFAESLQVANYGIGGHYDPHFDFHKGSPYVSNDGDRIATVLFYMSDVAQGGATVFTEIGLTVFPIKNSALFWFNLLPSGEGDISTRHAACPVLRGTKWASNKWIHNFGQELIMPCSREFNDE